MMNARSPDHPTRGGAMKIAIIGTGNVGTALGRRWAAAGHQVTFGSRHPADAKGRADAEAIGAADVGFAPVDLGPLSAARLLEPFALVWVTLAVRQKMGTAFALNVVRRPGR